MAKRQRPSRKQACGPNLWAKAVKQVGITPPLKKRTQAYKKVLAAYCKLQKGRKTCKGLRSKKCKK